MKKDRLNEIINELLFYVLELKKHETKEERIDFFENIIGLTQKEIESFGIE